ncbi:COG1355, Predicted dioxygenase [hydrothermal vent metagenome]|uniref:COG1355, Predicted dioxygenase n=1 Tax=hydrothermal vent metagenome TaxID=652676 RepID=A0A3B1AM26_9ZZZZ
MPRIRPPAVTDMFYPADAQELQGMIKHYLLEAAEDTTKAANAPKAVIVPHAGYVYSGSVAASAYARLLPARQKVRRVVLLGPSHRVPLLGLASSSAEAFSTPLGTIPLDREAIDAIEQLPQVHRLDEPHAREHSLEVQLPFLQSVLDDFTLVPLVVGDASPDEVAEVLEQLWDGPETLIVISSDLSHYHDYDTAEALDRATSNAIEQLQAERIHGENACGSRAVNGLLYFARRHGLHGKTIDLRNSGDTAGSRDRVVGYGAYVFE